MILLNIFIFIGFFVEVFYAVIYNYYNIPISEAVKERWRILRKLNPDKPLISFIIRFVWFPFWAVLQGVLFIIILAMRIIRFG